MEEGLSCTVDVSWILPREFEAVVNQGFRLVGSRGIIEIDAQDRGYRTCLEGEGSVTPNFNAAFSEESPLGYKTVKGYFLEPIKDFLLNVFHLKNGGSLESLEGRYPSGTDGLKVTQVACAVQRSIQEQRAVLISETEGQTA
jgi:predicted dehydrogenase